MIYDILVMGIEISANTTSFSFFIQIPGVVMSCISMSNYDNVIYKLVSLVFNNVHFRHFGKLKMRFQYIRQWVLLKKF